jgi:hypothetical protein
MKDYITTYNLYPESEPTLIQDDYMKNPNKDGFEPNLNQYIYKYWDVGYSYMFGKDASVGHLGPKAYYQYEPKVEYGILGNILGRGGRLPDGYNVAPFGSVFYDPNSYQIIHMTTMGNIASVYYSRLEEANRPGFQIQMEWQRTYQHALLVKQDGKWKWAAYDPLYSNNSDATQQDNTGSWLEAFKDKL